MAKCDYYGERIRVFGGQKRIIEMKGKRGWKGELRFCSPMYGNKWMRDIDTKGYDIRSGPGHPFDDY